MLYSGFGDRLSIYKISEAFADFQLKVSSFSTSASTHAYKENSPGFRKTFVKKIRGKPE